MDTASTTIDRPGAEVAVDPRTAEAAYSSYRSALRISRNLQELERTGSRKQEALKIASGRYRIPLGQLKRLVLAMDAERGIVHEHPQSYQRELDYRKAAAELEETSTGVCPQCDDARDRWNLKPEDGPDEVKVRVNPYEVEISGVLKPMLSCLGCYLAVDSDI